MSDVEFCDEVEEINLFYFAIVGEMVEEFADVGRTRYQPLHYPAESLEN